MKTHYRGLHVELTPEIKAYVDKRLASLDKFIQTDTTLAEIELSKVSYHQKGDVFRIEANIVGSGPNIYAAAEKSTAYEAVDHLREELERILSSRKQRKDTLFRKGALRIKEAVKNLRPWKKNIV